MESQAPLAGVLPAPLESPRSDEEAALSSSTTTVGVIPYLNAVWAVDFMSDTLYGGRRFRTLNLLDEGVREGLAIEIDTSLPAERVIHVLEQVVSWRGQPQAIRLDNGPEFLADRFITWCAERRFSCGTSNRASRIRMP